MSAWVVWSNYHQQWWCADRKGYSSNLLHAGVYNEQEAREITRLRSWEAGEPPEVAILLTQALKSEAEHWTGDCVVAHVRRAFADTDRVDWLGKERGNLHKVRGGVNRIGVHTGGWLACRDLQGPEERALSLREAIDMARGAINTVEEQEAFRAGQM